MRNGVRLIALLFLLVNMPAWAPLRGEPLDPTRLPPEWAARLDNLRAQAPLRADFHETRDLKMRKEPVQTNGTFRLRTDGVISLTYPDTKRPTTVVIDPSGVSLRIDQGKWRTMPDRAKTRPLLQTMAALMTLDLVALGHTHSIDGEQTDEGWVLTLDRKPDQGPEVPGHLVIAGTPEQVRRIELNLEPGQSITIDIKQVEPKATLTSDESSRFFR